MKIFLVLVCSLLYINCMSACAHTDVIISKEIPEETLPDDDNDNGGKEDGETDVELKLKLTLLPEFPYAASNPYIGELYKLIKVGSTTTTTSFKESDEVLAAIYAYLHPDSKMKGDKAVRDRLIVLLTNFLQYWPRGEKLGEMMFHFQCSLAYYMLQCYSPEDIPAELKDSWNEGLRRQTEYVFNQSADKKDLYNNHEVAALWLNGDIRLALGAYFSGKILNRQDWCKKIEDMMEIVVPQTLLNGGGTRYVSYQNESPSYHVASKQYMYWWYVLTRSENMKNTLRKMNKYCPLTIHPVGKGFVEYTSSPSWKPYYNSNIPSFPAAIAAYMFDDPYNYTLGKNDKTWELAFVYKPGVKSAELPKNYVVFDENNIGPRGQFGNWGYVGVARNVQCGDPELPGHPYPAQMEGKSALAGAYVVKGDAAPSEYALGVAFHSSMPAIKAEMGEETDFGRGHKFIDLTCNEHTTLTKGKEIYSLSSRYTLSKRRFKSYAWDGIQEWVFTPKRIIGLLQVESTADNNAVYGLVNRTKLVGGRRNVSGKDRQITDNGDGTYNYGELKVKIHDENYKGGHHISYFGIFNDKLDKRSCMLTLRDAKDQGNDTRITYQKGERRYVLIECTQESVGFAEGAKCVSLTNKNLSGLEFVEDGIKYIVVHNTSDVAQKLNAEFSITRSKMYVQHSWNETPEVITCTNNECALSDMTIPAYGHILLINNDRFDSDYNTYQDLFK